MSARRVALLAAPFVLGAAVLLGVALAVAGSRPEPARPAVFAEAPVAGETPAASAPTRPREVFSHSCGMCHTLRAAGASGLFGPDLDELRPSRARVRRMIETGSLDGVMPAGLLEGEEAERVSAWVARVAGRRARR